MIQVDSGLLFCASSKEGAQSRKSCDAPDERGFINRESGEIVFKTKDAASWSGDDYANDNVFELAAIENEPHKWAKIPKLNDKQSDYEDRLRSWLKSVNPAFILDCD